ncbi:protein of unknown function [Listeria monocytogenes R479a]|nr:protein of unknown function [Listeria monocytogenes R479a]CUK46257.1 conserved hypothetical protein [Listeria monocytogenes]CUK90588.1 conserved hypothetical protein [Listeria monocytogenes]CUL27996.1 conserved hypothetical protein [Listeria monocytogenes]CUL51819.1 conserved hypothetical protein [Listeria monocytogenes]
MQTFDPGVSPTFVVHPFIYFPSKLKAIMFFVMTFYTQSSEIIYIKRKFWMVF